MSKDTNLLQDIEESSYMILGSGGNLETDRIVSKTGDGLIFQLRVRNSSSKVVKIYSFVVAEFLITTNVSQVLEHGWLQCSEVLYKTPEERTEESHLFLQRDQNHISFKPEYGYLEDSIVSEWFTNLKMQLEDLFIGAVTTANQFSQIFIKKEVGGVRVRVTCQYDGLTIRPGQVIYSEKIYFCIGSETIIKNNFASCLAKEMKVKQIEGPIRGMCNSYYWHGNSIDEDLINRELTALEDLPKRLDLDYFQIDAGYTEYFGDWLDYRKRFPNGFEPIIKRIKKLGYKPAIWISPFAINPGTRLHDYHSSWFLKGHDHGHFDGRLTSPFDGFSNVTDLEVLDPTNEDVRAYLKEVFLHFKNLGFELFKTDFTYPVCLSNGFSKPVTRAQALRSGFEFIRSVVGSETKILTCITQISPVVGIANHVRTGIDTLNPFVCGLPGINRMVNEFMLEKNIRESQERLFLNDVVWRADPDMLVFRSGTGIDDATIEKHKEFAKKNNLSMWLGDSVANMDNITKDKLLKYFNK